MTTASHDGQCVSPDPGAPGIYRIDESQTGAAADLYREELSRRGIAFAVILYPDESGDVPWDVAIDTREELGDPRSSSSESLKLGDDQRHTSTQSALPKALDRVEHGLKGSAEVAVVASEKPLRSTL